MKLTPILKEKSQNKTTMKTEEKERLKIQYFVPLRRCTDY
jgi:hypothetical protein